MAFKLLKIAVIMTAGMLLAPKKGVELRADFLKIVKRYNKQLKAMINKIEIVWEKSQGVESDEVAADIELRIKEVRGAITILDAANTKEIAYQLLRKLDNLTTSLIKSAVKSPNIRSVAKEMAKITVNAVESGIKVYSEVKKTSSNLATRVVETGEKPDREVKVISLDKDNNNFDQSAMKSPQKLNRPRRKMELVKVDTDILIKSGMNTQKVKVEPKNSPSANFTNTTKPKINKTNLTKNKKVKTK